jgi:hypothetical protein
MTLKGSVGETYDLEFLCPDYPSAYTRFTVGPCRPGSALNSARKCELCPADSYSPRGESCVTCPSGARCRATLNGSSTVVGVALPETLGGYWLYLAPLSVVSVHGSGEYCFWDPQQCIPGM